MLLEFKVENFKSFANNTVFSMRPAPKQKGLDYSLLRAEYGGKKIRALCSSVIYGPNAAGKTNIIGAMDVMQTLMLRGNIRNNDREITPNVAASSLELIPNKASNSNSPVRFYIDFIDQGDRFQYWLDLELGQFMDTEYPRSILYESLHINDLPVFTRNGGLKLANKDSLLRMFPWLKQFSHVSLSGLATAGLNPQEMFLNNGFKSLIAPEIAERILLWVASRFMVIYRADSMQLIRRFSDPLQKTAYIETTTNAAARIFGIGSNALGYLSDSNDSRMRLYSLFDNLKGKNRAILAEAFESYGTLRFINLFPLVIKAMMTGGVLVVDEFDASIHPMALINIINIFHDSDLNRKGAQLIFNTHNPIFLNSNLLRRDEIKFVERDDTKDSSSLYALSDFGTSGTSGVRKNEDYMKNYFVERYGAVRNIDFSPIFEELLEQQEKLQ